MTKFTDIYRIASDNFGLITSAEAREAGINNKELVQYARRGRLERVGQGVYRLAQRIPEPNDAYALAVALVGSDSYLYGEAVLGMLELCPTNPSYLHIATPNRVRRDLPPYIRIVRTPKTRAGAIYDGIPCQRVADAIRSARSHMLPERLAEAVTQGCNEGYITQAEGNTLLEEMRASP